MLSTRNLLFSLSMLIRITLIIAIVGAALTFQWFVLFVSSLTFFLTFFPAFVEKNYKITLPLEFELIVTCFIFASLFLGEIHSFYDKYHWWDTLLHTISGIVLGFLGFLLIYTLNKNVDVKLNLSPFFVSFFAFCFAVTIGAMWEIFEFFMDFFLGLNMQKGLLNTMLDLIVDTLGALFASVIGYLYLKNIRYPLVESAVRKFVNANPHLKFKGKKK